MQFQQVYANSSRIRHSDSGTTVSFSPDLGREPTYFRGRIADPVRYRDAMSALRDVVVSDLKYKPKDHSAYQAWVREQYIQDIAEQLSVKQEWVSRMQEVHTRVWELEQKIDVRNRDYHRAMRRYFNYLYTHDKAGWFVLDPVITVAPDQVFFEAFSQDESSYGRLAVHEEMFRDVTEFEYGTTNIDFSDSLHGELLRMRTYRPTEFQIDPGGFEVATEGREVYKEQKIDVPESWIRGFLQVLSAMSLPTVSLRVQPIDIYNLCTFLRRNREKQGPRSLRYRLRPGQPVQVVIDPWGEVLTFNQSVYTGDVDREIRTWGRRRLFLLEKLLPLARSITIHLLGTGMPSFYIADLGGVSFTLGLSGWTRNDWSASGNFDLMVGGVPVSPMDSSRVFAELKLRKTATSAELARRTGLSQDVTQSALRQLCHAGRVMFDLETGCFRLRELTRDPLPIDDLKYNNPREKEAEKLITEGKARLLSVNREGEDCLLKGEVPVRSRTHQPEVQLDGEGRIVQAACDCYFFKQNKLMQGPCEHILATVVLYRRAMNGSQGERVVNIAGKK